MCGLRASLTLSKTVHCFLVLHMLTSPFPKEGPSFLLQHTLPNQIHAKINTMYLTSNVIQHHRGLQLLKLNRPLYHRMTRLSHRWGPLTYNTVGSKAQKGGEFYLPISQCWWYIIKIRHKGADILGSLQQYRKGGCKWDVRKEIEESLGGSVLLIGRFLPSVPPAVIFSTSSRTRVEVRRMLSVSCGSFVFLIKMVASLILGRTSYFSSDTVCKRSQTVSNL